MSDQEKIECLHCRGPFKRLGAQKFCSDQCRTLFFDAVKAANPLEAYCRKIGMDLKRCGSSWVTTCPFHDDRTPSFTVYRDDHFYCYGCDKAGDVIHLCQLEGITRLEAAEKLAGGIAPLIVVTPREKKVKPSPYVLTDFDIQHMRAACDRFSQDRSLINGYCRRRLEWTPEAIYYSAIDGDLGYDPDCRFGGFSGPATLFGYSNGIKARWRGKNVRWIAGAPNGKCWRQSSMHSGHQRVFVCEGETDVLTGLSLGIENDTSIVLGLASGTSVPNPDPFKGREIVFIPDVDSTGKKSERKLQEVLGPVARKFSILKLEDLFHGRLQ
jgi:hypothetical protein